MADRPIPLTQLIQQSFPVTTLRHRRLKVDLLSHVEELQKSPLYKQSLKHLHELLINKDSKEEQSIKISNISNKITYIVLATLATNNNE